MSELTKTQLLFVRACKSESEVTKRRLLRLYKKFYCAPKSDKASYMYISGILADIVDEFCPTTTKEVINQLNPDKFYGLIDAGPYNERVLNFLVSRIALTKCSDFPGFIPPCKYRDMEKTHE